MLARHVTALDRIRAAAADLLDPSAAEKREREAEQAAVAGDLAVSSTRVAAVLATSPWPDPADRSRAGLQNDGRDQVLAALDAVQLAAAAAVTRAADLRDRVGITSRILAIAGFKTPSIREANRAAQEADQAAAALKTARVDHRGNLASADRRGAAEADRREGQQQLWERRPEVAGARLEALGNDLVAAAVRDGNPAVREVFQQQDGLRIARETLLRREAERAAAERLAPQLHHARQHVEAWPAGPMPRAGC